MKHKEHSKKSHTKPPQAKRTEDKIAEYLNGWKRALADYENYKKESAKRSEDQRAQQTATLISELIPIIDNYETAIAHLPDSQRTQPWFTGLEQILKQMSQLLEHYGASRIKSIGEMFNPDLHDAADTVADEKKPDLAIISVVQEGYKLNEKLIRPAKVIVNKLDKKDAPN